MARMIVGDVVEFQTIRDSFGWSDARGVARLFCVGRVMRSSRYAVGRSHLPIDGRGRRAWHLAAGPFATSREAVVAYDKMVARAQAIVEGLPFPDGGEYF
jgi:hypothetical protein